jgi:transcriptional regulator with XRE-family HTH domain
MALFFDSSWFDARLAAAGLDRANLAAALGISQSDLAEIWKDQRELSAADVRIIAGLLGVGAASVAEHAGISTPLESGVTLRDLAERISRLESRLDEIHALLIEARTRAR